jgi:hypothetical protein
MSGPAYGHQESREDTGKLTFEDRRTEELTEQGSPRDRRANRIQTAYTYMSTDG